MVSRQRSAGRRCAELSPGVWSPKPKGTTMTTERTAQEGVPPAWAKRRMHHIFAPDGRAVIVAMDHTRSGPTAGLERPVATVAKVVAGGADAIMMTIGMAHAVAGVLGGSGLILALDSEGPIADYGVEQAI